MRAGHSGDMRLGLVLPPWHDGCHGSPVWQGFALRPSLRAMRAGHSGDMRLGRGFTAVAQRVPRLAGLAELCPAPTSARTARRGVVGHAAWPGFYRRVTTGATARRSGRALPCAPHCALCAQGTRGTCGLAGVLPPWHNECHGSPVWSSKIAAWPPNAAVSLPKLPCL